MNMQVTGMNPPRLGNEAVANCLALISTPTPGGLPPGRSSDTCGVISERCLVELVTAHARTYRAQCGISQSHSLPVPQLQPCHVRSPRDDATHTAPTEIFKQPEQPRTFAVNQCAIVGGLP